MASVNKVILIGNLGRDPEIRYTQNGVAVANFSIAVNEKWKDKDGEFQEKTEWVNIVAWARLAEICGEYLAKGRQVYVEGRLQTREWEDKEGNKRYTTEVVAQEIKFLGSGEGKSKPKESTQAPFDVEDDIPFVWLVPLLTGGTLASLTQLIL